jgi:signal transduction histidine kinase
VDFVQTFFERCFAAPIFPDEEETRQARLLHIMRMGMILVLLADCLLNIILLPANSTRWLTIGAAGIASNFVIAYFNREGQRRLAGFLLLALIWLIATLAAATAGGIKAPAARTYFVIVLFAGLLFGGRAGVYTGLICVASAGALVILESSGWLPPSTVQHTPLSLWIANTCFIFIVVLFVHVATKSTRDALQRARSELGERTRAEESLRKSEAERTKALQRERHASEEYPRRLIASQEAERTRIAAELHDGLGQNLLLVRNRAQLALSSSMAAELREQFESISGLASQALAEVRQISHDLHPYQIDHLGLTRAIEAMIETASESSGVIFERKLDSADDIFSGVAATNLYRIVQESLSNVLKHSGAARVHVRLERDVREVLLCVEDDGCGFQPERVNGGGLGLRNITERVHILGGTLRVASRPGEGTSVCVTIPIPELA